LLSGCKYTAFFYSAKLLHQNKMRNLCLFTFKTSFDDFSRVFIVKIFFEKDKKIYFEE
jgi:hypothetical protein